MKNSLILAMQALGFTFVKEHRYFDFDDYIFSDYDVTIQIRTISDKFHLLWKYEKDNNNVMGLTRRELETILRIFDNN